jgi:hypothetical protein
VLPRRSKKTNNSTGFYYPGSEFLLAEACWCTSTTLRHPLCSASPFVAVRDKSCCKVMECEFRVYLRWQSDGWITCEPSTATFISNFQIIFYDVRNVLVDVWVTPTSKCMNYVAGLSRAWWSIFRYAASADMLIDWCCVKNTVTPRTGKYSNPNCWYPPPHATMP